MIVCDVPGLGIARLPGSAQRLRQGLIAGLKSADIAGQQFLLPRADIGREVIGDGTHQRVVVNVARFDERAQRKVGGGG